MSRIKSILSRAQWLQHVTDWQGSGLSQATYCCTHQLNHSTFHGWVSRGHVPASAPAPLTTLPIVVQPSALAASHLPPIVLRHDDGWQLSLPADMQTTWLGQLLNQLV
ncbi:IS66 family insertion sequence element accessory protein TnpA [Undibacterium sp. SXout11W]|uniref:IS66 family insertion sequence element accessory protein TnpA n=1 Tax=Undibacterium sp. SXout11W TaxID=3413050 RepID=UPI003BF2FDE0